MNKGGGVLPFVLLSTVLLAATLPEVLGRVVYAAKSVIPLLPGAKKQE